MHLVSFCKQKMAIIFVLKLFGPLPEQQKKAKDDKHMAYAMFEKNKMGGFILYSAGVLGFLCLQLPQNFLTMFSNI